MLFKHLGLLHDLSIYPIRRGWNKLIAKKMAWFFLFSSAQMLESSFLFFFHLWTVFYLVMVTVPYSSSYWFLSTMEGCLLMSLVVIFTKSLFYLIV